VATVLSFIAIEQLTPSCINISSSSKYSGLGLLLEGFKKVKFAACQSLWKVIHYLVIWGQVLQTLGEAMVRLFQGIEQNMDHVLETKWTRVIPLLGHLFANIAIFHCDYLFM
jgi:hypothetical protein